MSRSVPIAHGPALLACLVFAAGAGAAATLEPITVADVTRIDELGFACIEEADLEAAFAATGKKGSLLPQTCLPKPCDRQIAPDELAQQIGRDPTEDEWSDYVSRYAEHCVAETTGVWPEDVLFASASSPVTDDTFFDGLAGTPLNSGVGSDIVADALPRTGGAFVPGTAAPSRAARAPAVRVSGPRFFAPTAFAQFAPIVEFPRLSRGNRRNAVRAMPETVAPVEEDRSARILRVDDADGEGADDDRNSADEDRNIVEGIVGSDETSNVGNDETSNVGNSDDGGADDSGIVDTIAGNSDNSGGTNDVAGQSDIIGAGDIVVGEIIVGGEIIDGEIIGGGDGQRGEEIELGGGGSSLIPIPAVPLPATMLLLLGALAATVGLRLFGPLTRPT